MTERVPPWPGPARSLADLEEITNAWVHWHNSSESPRVSWSLHRTRGDSVALTGVRASLGADLAWLVFSFPGQQAWIGRGGSVP